jgi:hypothetical protein
MSIIEFIRQNPSPQQVEDFIEQEARRRIAEQEKGVEG